MWRCTRAFLLLTALVVVGACSARESQPDTDSPSTVVVENQSFSDMNVFVLDGTRRLRLGLVPGVSTRRFTIPERLIFGISSLRFQVDPVGSQRAPVSQEITLSQGQSLRLVIPSTIR